MSTSPARPNTGSDSESDSESGSAGKDFPFVALTVQTTGIHPSTARMVAVDAVTFNAVGEIGQDFHAVLNPGTDPGPRHLHGLSHEEVSAGQNFSQILIPLDHLIDGRTLVVHDIPFVWGFVVSEARRAITTANRQYHSRNRNRGNSRRRRQKIGHVPRPERIIDALASARRQGAQLEDIRLATAARHCRILAPSAVATAERASAPESQTSRKATELLVAVYLAQAERGPLASTTPDEVRSDKFGLQRSHLRVDAEEAPRVHQNPGPYRPGHELEPGMEIVVAPEITVDPDEIIAAITRHGLNYSEKLSRETSLVVCNATTDLVGKPMHAHRKGIPLMSDQAFLAAIERMVPASNQPSAAPPDAASASSVSGKHAAGNEGTDRGGHSTRTGQENRTGDHRRKRNLRRRRRRSRGGANRSEANNTPSQAKVKAQEQAQPPSSRNGEDAAQSTSRGSRRKRGGGRRGGRGHRGGGRRGGRGHRGGQNSATPQSKS